MPRSGLDTIEEMVWLPRLFDKARRFEQLGGDARLIDGYCYGDNDFIDGKVLRFLHTDDATVSALLRDHPDPEAARIIVERSGRTREERRQFSAELKRSLNNFAFMEADEGRLLPGIRTSALRFFYNRLLMPIFYARFRRAEEKRG
jgi:Domain of unknown function (DUF5069)